MTPDQNTHPVRRRRSPLARLFIRCTVAEVEPVTRSTRRVRLVADALRELAWTPGQQIRLHVHDLFALQTWLRGPKDALRTYSVWEHDPVAGAVELRLHDHGGDGPGVGWARRAVPGQAVTLTGPEGDFVLRPAPYYVFAGEETATVAIGAMVRALAPGLPVYGVLESETAGDELPIPARAGLRRVHRNGAPAAASPTLLAALRDLDLPDEPGAAYLAGEARTCQLLRDHLVRGLGWPRDAVKVKPFWAPGKRGMD